MRWRKVGMGAALAAIAVALSGCVVFMTPPTAKQKKSSVLITVKACASQTGGSPPVGSCPNDGNSGENAGTHKSQLFVGFRVPKDAKAPQSFIGTPSTPVWKSDLHFTFSKAYASELQRLDKAPAGQKWVGYTSQYFSYSATSGGQSFKAKASFGLPLTAKGTFHYEVVIGGRQQTNTSVKPDPKEPIDCQDSLTTGYGGPGSHENWVCVDDSFSSSLKLH